MSIEGDPEIRVERQGALVRRVLFIREGHDDVDLTDLFRIQEIRRKVEVSGLPKVEFDVIARLVEIETE